MHNINEKGEQIILAVRSTLFHHPGVKNQGALPCWSRAFCWWLWTGQQTAWSPPEGLAPAPAAGPVQLPQPHAPSTMPDPSAPGTPLSRAVAAVACISPRQMALSRGALQELLGSAAPLSAQVIPTATEVSASAGEAYGGLAAAAADAVADAAAIVDPSGEGLAAGELTTAGGCCSVEVSVSGQIGSAGCTAPDASGVSVPVENMEAAKETPLKKRRKKIVQETITASLSPPGAFGRAVFGRKKRVRHFEHT